MNRQIGRILQQNQRAAARFTIASEPDGCAAGFRLRIDHDASFDDWAALSEGAYLLRSNIADWSDHELWKAYIQLTQAEAAFRIQKDQLNLRPVWRQREDRVQAHSLVCFLALVLFKEPRDVAGARGPRQRAARDPRRTCPHPVPRRRPADRDARRDPSALRRPPDAAQAALLDRLGIVLPKRMRLSENDLPLLALRPEPTTHPNVVPTFRLRTFRTITATILRAGAA